MVKRIEAEVSVLAKLSHEILLGIDLLSLLGLEIRINRQRVFPPLRNYQGATCTVQGPIPMSHLRPEEQKIAKRFLASQLKRLTTVKGVTPLAKHEIRLIDPTPLKQRYRPRNPAIQEVIDKEVNEIIAEGVIRPFSSPWSSPVLITRRKDGRPRFCIDFRRLNQVSKKDAYTIPQINAILDNLRGARYLSSIDLKNGYWHVPLTEESKLLTAFTVPGRRLFEFNVMPFGLHTAPSTFQRLLDRIITLDMAPQAFAYLDDIIVCTRTFEEHMSMLGKIFDRLYEAKLRPNTDKCHFFRPKLQYLGHLVDEKGLHTDPEKVAIQNLSPPRNIKEARRFLGLISWYRRFIKDVSQVAAPLHQLLKKKAQWVWTKEHQEAFEELRRRLTSAPILACPDWTKEFVLQTDASKEGLGTVLTQSDGDTKRIIA